MDPITMAIIVGALTTVAGKIGDKVVEGTAKAAGEAVSDAYHGLKALLQRKFGAQSEVVKAAEAVEAMPDSAGRRQTLQEEVKAAKADQDAELLKLAQALLAAVKATPGGAAITQTAIGNENIQVAGDQNQVNVNRPKA